MANLRQEMREMFEKHSAMEFNERNSGFEDGLLEKIVNMTFANLCHYSGRRWQLTAVRAPLLLQKLYRLLNDKRILASSVALLVADPGSARRTDGVEGDIGLLSMSLAYAAKYYCVESFVTRNINSDALAREFSLDRSSPVAAVAGLGIYRDTPLWDNAYTRYVYSDIVKEL